MKKNTYTNLAFIIMLVLSVSLFKNAIASEKSSIYDESVYTSQMEKNMDKLDALYLRFHDNNLASGKVQKAKREYFKIARRMLHDMNERLDKLDPKAGEALSQTDMLVMNHIQIMLIDMLASIHQSEWQYGDEAY